METTMTRLLATVYLGLAVATAFGSSASSLSPSAKFELLPEETTSIRYPVLVQLNYELMPLAKFRDALAKQGYSKNIPLSISITLREEAKVKIETFSTETEDLADSMGNSMEFYDFGTISEYVASNIRKPLCYYGIPTEAVDLLASLNDCALTDQDRIIGWKYQNESHLFKLPTGIEEKKFPKKWKTWPGTPDEILIVVANKEYEPATLNYAVVKHCR